MRILIADSHDVVRRGLKEILLESFPGTMFLEAGTAQETLRLMADTQFDLLLLDINMPGSKGLSVLRDATRDHHEVPVVVVSVHPEDQYAKLCLSAGAAAYIRKDRASEELVVGVKTALSTRDSSSAIRLMSE